MIFVQLKVDNFWTTLSHSLTLYFYSLSSFHFIIFVAKEEQEKENYPKKLSNFGCSNNIALKI
jgi:hypothetical protein